MNSAGPHRSNPFPGLRPFEETEDDLFFGRDGQVDDLVARLRRRRFIAVVGTSGSGKSSLVRAGLLPALHGGFMAGVGSRWHVVTLRPGSAPIANLAQALDAAGLVGASDAPQEVRIGLARAGLGRGTLGLVELLRESGLGRNENILILVDQFEELFRFQQDNPNEAAAFVKLLLAASESAEVSVYVVVTMRSDFLGECAQFEGLSETINDGLVLVPRMSWDQLRQAIEGPIQVAGAEIDPALVTRLLNDLGDNPDQLPVLQHALMRTWDLRSDTEAPIRLRLDDYARTGSLTNAVSLHCDAVLTTFNDRDRIVAEKLFKCLTVLGPDNRGIRRPTRLDDTYAITGASLEEVCRVVEGFRMPGRSFLMPPTDALTENTVIDIAHEGLMRIWTRLASWLDEEARSGQEYRRLATAAILHSTNRAALWRDPDLQNAENWRAAASPNAAWACQLDPRLDFVGAMAFLEKSIRERQRERDLSAQRAVVRERLERTATVERLRGDAAVRVAQVTRRYLIVAVILFLLVIGALAMALKSVLDLRVANGNLRSVSAQLTSVIEQEMVAASPSTTKTPAYYERLIQGYTLVLQLTPTDVNAYMKRGEAYYGYSHFVYAIGDFSQAIHLQGLDTQAYYDRSLAYAAVGEYDRAIADCNKAIMISPEFALAFVNRGHAYFRKGNYSLAMADFNAALQRDPELAVAYVDRGLLYSKETDYGQALTDLNVAIKLDPTDASVYRARAVIYDVLAEPNLAAADRSEANQLDLKGSSAL